MGAAMRYNRRMILDIIVVAIIVLSMVRGKAKGFGETLIKLFALGCSVTLGVLFTGRVSDILSLTGLDETITKHLQELTGSGDTNLSDFIPGIIGKTLDVISHQGSAAGIRHLTNLLMLVFSFILIVAAVYFVAHLLRKNLKRNRKERTLIGTVDSGVGLLFGLIKGVILVFLFLAFMFPLAGIFAPEHIKAMNEALNTSYIAGFLYDINPLLIFINKLPF
jgi:uncharacterized membrane protein required for colicin V production